MNAKEFSGSNERQIMANNAIIAADRVIIRFAINHGCATIVLDIFFIVVVPGADSKEIRKVLKIKMECPRCHS